jgi:thermitase
MKNKAYWLAGILILLLLPLSFALAAEALPTAEPGIVSLPVAAPQASPGEFVPGEIIIGFKATASAAQMKAAAASVGGTVVKTISLHGTKIVKVLIPAVSRAEIDGAVTSLGSSSMAAAGTVKFAEPNVIRTIHQATIQSQSNDPLLRQQWGYYDVSANWMAAQTAKAPVVAVIDTGVDYTHPDLAGKVLPGYDFVNEDSDPMDDHGHGTHVAGVIAANANNGLGIAGISWTSKILPVKVCSSGGSCSDFDIVEGIKYAANQSAVKVLNMSLGGAYSATMDEAVDYAVNAMGKLLVASAGNAATSTPSYPAGFAGYNRYFSKVLAVAAHGSDHCKADFSNWGAWVSISAPGVDIVSTYPGNSYVSMNGTSMASPHVAGAAAVAWARYPKYRNNEIGFLLMTKNSSMWTIGILNRNGTCWPDDNTTFQRVDVWRAIDPDVWEGCSEYPTYGFAMDASTGQPLTGAKVTAKKDTDYVPSWGQRWTYGDDIPAAQGPGLFNVITHKSSPTEPVTVSVQKTGYPTVKFLNTSPYGCSWTYAGNLPIPTKEPLYWLAVTWNYGFSTGGFDSYLSVPGYGTLYWSNPGHLDASPWAGYLWDWLGAAPDTLNRYSGVMRIVKVLPGEYVYYMVPYGGAQDSWLASGIKAYIYRGGALVATFTPPAASGSRWNICRVNGNTIIPDNTLTP